MDDYVTKPIKVANLVAALEKCLKTEESAPASGPAATEAEKAAPPAEAGRIPVFDRPAMLERLMQDEGLARTVMESFLSDQPLQLKQMREFVAAGDIQRIQQQAHKIKGAAATVGGEAMRAVALAMEQAARTGDLEGAKGGLPALEAEFERLQKAMRSSL